MNFEIWDFLDACQSCEYLNIPDGISPLAPSQGKIAWKKGGLLCPPRCRRSAVSIRWAREAKLRGWANGWHFAIELGQSRGKELVLCAQLFCSVTAGRMLFSITLAVQISCSSLLQYKHTALEEIWKYSKSGGNVTFKWEKLIGIEKHPIKILTLGIL